MDRGAWWAAVHRVAQSRTWLKQLSMHACIGEGNGNPLQCSCLENPRDREAWWAAIYRVAQSQTWLKQCSSSRVILSYLIWGKKLGHRDWITWSKWNSWEMVDLVLEPRNLTSETVFLLQHHTAFTFIRRGSTSSVTASNSHKHWESTWKFQESWGWGSQGV